MLYALLSCIIIIMSSVTFAQTEYVPADNQVYEFLQRMETLSIIPDYNSFEIPKTRKEIAEYLKTVIDSESGLDDADQAFLNDLEIEFENELSGILSD